MNLQQFRILSAATRLTETFTTEDLCRETGVSKDAVRKTYQRYPDHFETVAQASSASGGRTAVRRMTEHGRAVLLAELRAARVQLEAPPAPRGPEGEPLSLLAAEKILYDLVPAVGREARGDLIEEAAGSVELATVSLLSLPRTGDSMSPARNAAIRSRLSSVRARCEQVETVHRSMEKVARGEFAARIAELADRVLSATVARAFAANSIVGEDLASLLRDALQDAASSVASALWSLGTDASWLAALGVPRCWFEGEAVALKSVEDEEADGRLTSMPFAFQMKWKPGNLTSFGEAAAPLLIAVDSHNASRHIDTQSGRVLDRVDLPVARVAEQMLANWWRMRWEAKPWGPIGSSWLNAHSMRHFLGGVAAPNLWIWSDNEMVRASAMPFLHRSRGRSYVSEFRASVPPSAYEHAVDGFVSEMAGRLSSAGEGYRVSELARQLADERQDPDISRYRRFEAMLGFDRDSAPKQVIQELRDLAAVTGETSSAELAHAFAGQLAVASDHPDMDAGRGDEIRKMLAATSSLSKSSLGVHGELVSSRDRPILFALQGPNISPWNRGLALARAVRKELGFSGGRVDERKLASMLGLTAAQMLSEAAAGVAELLLGMAVRNQHTSTSRFIFRMEGADSRRFEAARMLADGFLAAPDEHWLLTTEAKTARQQAQRAFAVEFLCPIAELKTFFRGSYSAKEAFLASQYYGVSLVAVERHVANNARELLGETA